MRILPYLFLTLLLVSGMHAGQVAASEELLILIDGEDRHDVPLESLREQAGVEFTIYAPFRAREVKIRGMYLETVLKHYFSRVPERIKLVAYDEYALVFENWQREHWVLVTHEDGKPLSLRNQGPVRLVERDYAGRDPKNLRAFNDWIWMLRSIESIP